MWGIILQRGFRPYHHHSKLSITCRSPSPIRILPHPLQDGVPPFFSTKGCCKIKQFWLPNSTGGFQWKRPSIHPHTCPQPKLVNSRGRENTQTLCSVGADHVTLLFKPKRSANMSSERGDSRCSYTYHLSRQGGGSGQVDYKPATETWTRWLHQPQGVNQPWKHS